MPPMDTADEAFSTADEIAIFTALADDIMEEEQRSGSPATPAINWDGPWMPAGGGGGGESGGLLGIDMPFTPMQSTAVVGG